MPSIRKPLILLLECAAGLVALAVLATVLLIGRLMTGPMTITHITPWLEYVLSQPQYGITAKIEQSTASWDRDENQFVLDLGNVGFTDSLGQDIANIPQIILVLRPLGYFDETHSPWIVMAKHPHMHVRIDEKGVLRLGAMGGAAETPEEAKAEKELAKELAKGETKLDMGAAKTALQDIIHAPHLKASGLGLFANLNIEDAGLTVIDEPRKATWNISVPQLSLKRVGDDFAGKAGMIVEKADLRAQLDFTLDYSADEDRFHASWSFDHVNPSLFTSYVAQLKVLDVLSSPLTGSISIDFDGAFTVYAGALNLNLDKGTITLPGLFPKPLDFNAGQIVAHYNADKRMVIIDPVRLDLDKVVIKADARVDVKEANRKVDARLQLQKLDVAQLPFYWPVGAGGNAREWILENIKSGLIDEASVRFGFAFDDADIDAAEISSVAGTIKISDAELVYWQPLPSLHKVAASATFTDKGFDIDVASGEIGAISLKPSHITITGLDDEEQIMDLTANIAGPAKDILRILDRSPLGYSKKMNINPDGVEGTADGALKMRFPLLKDLSFERIDLFAETRIAGGKVAKIADILAVEAAEVMIKVDKDKLTIDGNGQLNTIPARLKWEERFAPAQGEPYSKAEIEANTEAQNISKFGVSLDVRTDKPIPFKVNYTRFSALSRLAVAADAMEARLEAPDLFFIKEAGASTKIAIVLEWGDGKPMRLSTIEAMGDVLAIKGSGAFDAVGKDIASLSLNPLRLGATNARLVYMAGKDGPMVAVSGESLDIRKMLESPAAPPPPSKKPPSPLSLNLQLAKVITGEKSKLTDVKIKASRSSAGWQAINASMIVANGTPFTFTLGPHGDGKRYIKASAPDMGNVLQALDVTDTLIGGKLTIDGKSEPGDANAIFGHIKLENFRVKNMPILAQLISAISPDGLASLLTGSGLGFSELNGEYMWKGDLLDINKAHTSTGSLGLTTAGKIDLAASTIDLQGQVIPVVFISKIISNIPIIGDILTGGDEGGIFSATYSVKGPLAKPSVSVNPVSVLAPGIIRDILFLDKGGAPAERRQDRPAAKKPKKN